MKKINYFKITFDLLIAITFALLFNPKVLGGLTFHETAGISIGGAILVHVLLNSKWVKNVTKKIFDPKLSGKLRFSYLLNLLLLISMTIVIVTGILISRVLFPNLLMGENHGVRGLHSLFSNLTLGLVGIHVGVHWQWVMNVFKKMFITKAQKPRFSGIAAAVVVIGLLIWGTQLYASKFSSQATGFNSGQRQFNEQGFDRGAAGDNNQGSSTTQVINQNGNNNFQGPGNGDFGERHFRGGDFRGGRGEGSPFSVILRYFLILAVFIVPTYFVEKRILRKKSKLNV